MERERFVGSSEGEAGNEADAQSTAVSAVARTARPVIEKRQAAEMRQKWGEVIEGVTSGRTRVIVERYGRPIAALISTDELACLEEMERGLAEPIRKLAYLQSVLGHTFPEELSHMAQSIERMQREIDRLLSVANFRAVD